MTLVPQEGAPPQPYQRWADRARVPTANAEVQFYLRSDASCAGGHDSCAGTPPLYIYLGTRNRWTLYHELGHIFDYVVMGADGDPSALTGWRQQFLAIRGDRRASWREGVNPPAEQFAQAYMFCASNPRRLPRGPRRASLWDYGYAGTTSRQHRRSCKLIYRAWLGGGSPGRGNHGNAKGKGKNGPGASSRPGATTPDLGATTPDLGSALEGKVDVEDVSP